jgi:carbonic anhydrase
VPDELPSLPRRGLVVLTCMDHRIDPLAALDLRLGDAMVLRNAGGRVTRAFLRDLEMLALVTRKRGGDPGELELILMQHTKCGAGSLAEDQPEQAAAYLGVSVERLGERAPTNPHGGVSADIELLAAEDSVPGSITVTGLVYDVDTRRVEQVERRAPLRAP